MRTRPCHHASPKLCRVPPTTTGLEIGVEMCSTPPYSDESNGTAESFVKSFKRDDGYLADLWTAA